MGWWDFTTGQTGVDVADHSDRHEAGGADEISLAGLTVVAEDIEFTLEEVTSATTLTADHFLVIVNASGSIRITLPAAASHTNRMYTIKNIHSTGIVTIDANSSEKIDGELTVVLNLQYAYVTIVSDGDEWFIVGGEYVKMEDLLAQQLGQQEETIEILKNIETHLSLGSGEELEKEESE